MEYKVFQICHWENCVQVEIKNKRWDSGIFAAYNANCGTATNPRMTQNLSFNMFFKFFALLYVIICLTECSDVQPMSVIRLALITDAHSSTNWTGVFQRALELRDTSQHLQHEVKFEILTVSKTNLQSFEDILDMLCHEVLPRQVHAIFLPSEISVPNEFIQFIGLIPLLILGTNRDPTFETAQVGSLTK